jgi:hypothetical protein
MRDGEPNVYGGLATVRNGYMQMQWSRTQMYLVFNTVALPVSFGTNTEGTIKLIVAIAGLIVSLCIPVAVARGERWTKFFNQKMAELEQLDGQDGGVRVAIFSDPTFESIRTSRLASRKVFMPIAILVSVAWFAQVVIYSFPHLSDLSTATQTYVKSHCRVCRGAT